MNMKKWSAGVMAAAMAFSLALPAGAAADPEAIQPIAMRLFIMGPAAKPACGW